MANMERWCFAWLMRRSSDLSSRGLILNNAKWDAGQIITVSFLGGPQVYRGTAAFDKACAQVKEAAREWVGPGMANLTLDFVARDGNIRISFMAGGSWSLIGNSVLKYTNPDEATMNFSWPLRDDLTPADIRGETLHEFGHALGLAHEHQSPIAGINWDHDAVIRDLTGPGYRWSLADIYYNVFDAYTAAEVAFSGALDPNSIMMYPIPARWTLDGFQTDWVLDFSEHDRTFIQEQYPFEE